MTATPERRTATLALGDLQPEGAGYVLNTGGAYGGEMHLTGTIRLRLGAPGDELPMLREHDRARLVGVWTGVKVDGRRIIASGIRWAEHPDAVEARGLVEGRLLRAASIGFSASWAYRDQVAPAELERLARDEGADLARLQYVLTDVEVYEASLVSVGADAQARWGAAPQAPAEAGALSRGPSTATVTMARHLVDHHGLTAEQAAAWLLASQIGGIVEAVTDPAEAPAADEGGDDDGEDSGEAAAGSLAAEDGALFDVPDGIRAAAQQGLDWREEYGRGGTATGVRTARALVSGRVSADLLLTIAAWWARFSEVEGPAETDDGEPTALAIARALWGGDDAQGWADDLADDARAEVDGEMSAVAPARVHPGILALLRPAPAASGIDHLLLRPGR